MSSRRRDRWKALTRFLQNLAGRWRSREAIFAAIYRKNRWYSKKSVSGIGSELEWTGEVRKAIPEIVRLTGTKTLLDAACGDFHWFKEISVDLERYIGADIVPELIAANQRAYAGENRCFLKLDITHDSLPQVDLILCRDCLVHLSFEDIFAALQNIIDSGSTYLLTTTFPRLSRNEDLVTGGWRPLNLQIAPFHLPEPLVLINEHYTRGGEQYADKSLALWKVADLQGR